ncbi:cupredoxin family copper-binding protein [Mycobacterium sp. DL592]|uniref:cupredoxin domain-containing protein n=1 Tax=Mycobacterium sp. DL592 TaxID=2675524 RepID=UPI00141F14C0|nr:cupredoxin family copper-binding protein [Mycobacterium sp. DL592]
MKTPQRQRSVALTAIVVAALAGCAPTGGAPPPTVDFGANGGTSVGMPGMTAMPSAPPTAPATASSAAPQAPVGGTAVTITNFAFVPAALTVTVGATVTWSNHDEEPHTVAADDGSFHSPGMDTNGTYSYTFTKPGSYSYICSIHPFMHGTVVVTP